MPLFFLFFVTAIACVFVKGLEDYDIGFAIQRRGVQLIATIIQAIECHISRAGNEGIFTGAFSNGGDLLGAGTVVDTLKL